MQLDKIAIVDPGSYSLSYDYFYILEISKYCFVDFYCSNTQFNYIYLDKLKTYQNVKIIEYEISTSVTSKLRGVLNYLKMLVEISKNAKKYKKIHFMWSIFSFLEIPVFYFLKNKLIFTFHNDVPHDYCKNTYFPFKVINFLAHKKIFVSQFTEKKFLKNYAKRNSHALIQHGLLPLSIDLPIQSTYSKELIEEIPLAFWGRVTEYKGLDFFTQICNKNLYLKVLGKWDKSLKKLYEDLSNCSNITIIDRYFSIEELENLFADEIIFVLPYKNATQSGVLYTLLAYEKVFLSTDMGENGLFLKVHGLDNLLFSRDNIESFYKAHKYALENYFEIKQKLALIKTEYMWNKIIIGSVFDELYGE